MTQNKKSRLIRFQEEEQSENGEVSKRVKIKIKNLKSRSLAKSKEASPRYLGLFNRTPS